MGHSLKVFVTASSAAGTAVATSVPTVAVSPAGTSAAASPTNVKAPQILGKAQKAWSFASASDRDWVFGKTALELYPKLKD